MHLITRRPATRRMVAILALVTATLGLTATTAPSADAAVRNCSSVSSDWPTLVRYDTGTCVKFAQQRLAVWEFLDGTYPADGSFGPGMLRSVLAFQKARGLVQDGKIGPATEAALKQTPPPNGP